MMLSPPLSPPMATASPTRSEPAVLARSALDLHAALLSSPQLSTASAAWVRALAREGGFARVSLAWSDGDELRLIAGSWGPVADLPAAELPPLRLALAECLDQASSISWPELRPLAQPRLSLAHQRLLASRPATVLVASVPVVVAGQPLGVLCVERQATPWGPADLDALEHLAGLAGPVLQLMQLNERALPRRAADAWRTWWRASDRQAQRRFALASGLLLAALALWPQAWQVGGHARLEGAVQRVLVAPADGFLRQVHARPGQAVKAGQVLVELADQDLLLAQQRWESQLAQFDSAYATANARADRAQQVMQQARAAEAEAQLALVQMQLARGRIEAPFDGLVVQGDLSQQLGAPLAKGAELMTVAPADRFRVVVEVDERDIAAVAVGQPGQLALSALPWDSLPLRVTRVSPMASALDGRNVFEVEAELLARDASLRPGLQGRAQLTVGRQPPLWGWARRLATTLRAGWWAWWG